MALNFVYSFISVWTFGLFHFGLLRILFWTFMDKFLRGHTVLFLLGRCLGLELLGPVITILQTHIATRSWCWPRCRRESRSARPLPPPQQPPGLLTPTRCSPPDRLPVPWEHLTCHRLWGQATTTEEGERLQMKKVLFQLLPPPTPVHCNYPLAVVLSLYFI